MKNIISNYIEESINVKEKLIENNLDEIQTIIEEIIACYKRGNKILICGNGGSAADAQHFAAELVGSYKLERIALPAIAITTDTSNLTAIGNDYGYDKIFKRQVEALGEKGDILISISTSGNSPNCIFAIDEAQKKGLNIINLLGKNGGKMKNLTNLNLVIPSKNTPRIQECHILIIHSICEILENTLFENE